MTDNRLERYKEALRSGHVAVLRGRLHDALAAYREAGAIAVDRAAPRTAIGGVYLRLGDPESALAAYDEALRLAPEDDAALNGRAQVLAILDRPAESAAVFDQLAEVRASAGKVAEACDALRRAIELEPSGVRRHRQQELARQLRLAAGDEQAERALARALRLLDEGDETGARPADAAPSPGEGDASPADAPADAPAAGASPFPWIARVPAPGSAPGASSEEPSAPAAPAAEPAPAAGPARGAEPVPAAAAAAAEPARGSGLGRANAASSAAVADAAREAAPAEAPAPVAATAQPAAPVLVAPARPAGPDGEALSIAADEAARHGDAGGAVVAAMAAARAFRAVGHPIAALDVCIQALAAGPDDVNLHLLIAELQVEQGWPAVAAETYRNLVRLADLDGDPDERFRVLAAARAALPDDARFADAPA